MTPLVPLVPAPLDDPSLSSRLRQMAQQPAHASRHRALTSLAGALDGDASASHWAEMDVYAALDVDGDVDGLQQEPRATQVLEALRTGFIFCPLLVTWAGLLLAGRAYNRLVEERPSDADLPFLKLWFDGFGGRTAFTLDRLALVTVVLVLGLIVVSLLLQQRHARDDEAYRRARLEQNRLLRQTATAVTLALAEHRLSSPERFRAELTRTSAEFGTLAENLTSVSDTVTRSLGDLGTLAQRLEATTTASRDSAAETAHAAGALTGVLTQLREGLTTSLREVEQSVAAAHDRLVRQVQDSEATFGRVLHQSSADLGQHVDTATGWVVGAAEALLRQSEQAVSSSEHVFDRVSRAVNEMHVRIDAALSERVGAEEVAQAANALAAEARGLRTNTTELSKAAQQLAVQDPHPSADTLAAAVQGLDRVCVRFSEALEEALTRPDAVLPRSPVQAAVPVPPAQAEPSGHVRPPVHVLPTTSPLPAAAATPVAPPQPVSAAVPAQWPDTGVAQAPTVTADADPHDTSLGTGRSPLQGSL